MARKNSGNMGEFTFKMRLSSEQIEQLWELTKEDPTRRSIIARMDDGSYRVLGEIVKLPDCPQEEFDKALERLNELANEVEKEQQPAKHVPAEDTIKGWVARDGHGALVFSNEKPSRLEWCGWKLWKISRGTPAVVLPNTFLPSLRWEDEPIPVRVIIEEIKD